MAREKRKPGGKPEKGDNKLPDKPGAKAGKPKPAPPDPEQTKSAVLHGHIAKLPNASLPKLVKIYISSSDTDTTVERSALTTRVYPSLRTLCQQKGYDLEFVDLNFLCRSDDLNDHAFLPLCLEQIDQCQRLSTGPSFLSLLGQKYGEQVLPCKILAEEFEALYPFVKQEDDRDILESWYLRDDNHIPPVYVLQPITAKIAGFLDNDKGKRKDAQTVWATVSERLKGLLRKAAVDAFADDNPELLQKYLWSGVEEEVLHGIINSKNQTERCVCFSRTISDISKYKHQSLSLYLDMKQGKMNEQAAEFLDTLKKDKLPLYLPKENIVEYAVKWTEKGIDIENCQEHKKYLDQFCTDAEKKLGAMITAAIEKRQDASMDELTHAVQQHVNFAKQEANSFCGREQFLEQIQQKLQQQADAGKKQPLVISGATGSGKTATLAKLVQLMPDWLGDENVVILPRFLGMARDQMTTQQLLASICQQLYHVAKKQDYVVPKEAKELKREFQKLLKEAEMPVVFLLDALHLLTDEGDEVKEWLPTKLPPNVTIILSSLPVGQCEIISKFKKLLTPQSFLTVPSFGKQETEQFMEKQLKNASRTLTDEQRKLVEDACASVQLPLYVKLVLHQAVRWNSAMTGKDIDLATTMDDLITNMFEQWEQKYGQLFVSHTLGLITASKRGLSTHEICDILSLDDIVLNETYKHHKAPLRRLPPLLWVRLHREIQGFLMERETDGIIVFHWCHNFLQSAAENRYLNEDKDKRLLHGLISDYFLGKWALDAAKPYEENGKKNKAVRYVSAQPLMLKVKNPELTVVNKRALVELPYHLTQAGQQEELLEACLINFDFIYYKLKFLSFERLLEDYDHALESGMTHPDIEKMQGLLRQARDAVEYEAEQLPAQLIWRLPAIGARNSSRLTSLLHQAMTPSFSCLYSSQEQSVDGKKGDEVARYSGHDGDVQCMDISKNKSRIISCGTDGTLRVWDAESCKQLAQLDVDAGDPSQNTSARIRCMFCLGDRSVLILGSLTQVWDLLLGCPLTSIDIPTKGSDSVLAYMLPDGETLVSVTTEMILWDLNTGKKIDDMKVDKPGKLAKHITPEQILDQLAGFDNTVVLFRKGTRGIQVTEFLEKKKTTKKFDILGKKMEVSHAVKIGCSESGLLAYLYYDIKEDHQPQPITIGLVDLRNVKNIAKVFETNQIEMGLHSGLLESRVLSTGENEFMFITCPDQSQTAVYVWRPPTEDIKPITVLEDSLLCVQPFGDGKVLWSLGKSDGEIELKDVRFLEEQQDRSRYEASTEPFGGLIHTLVPNSGRYVYYMTSEDHIAVWDLAVRCTVRMISAPFYLPYGSLLPKNKVVAILANQSNQQNTGDLPKVIEADLLNGKVTNPAVATSWNIPNFNFRLHHIGNDTVLFPGPKPHQISAVKISTGKTTWTLEVKDGEEIAGLLVSEDKRLLLAECPLSPQQLCDIRDNPKDQDVHLYCFDLQQRRRLPDLKVTSQGALSTSLTETQQAVLTPDGKHYISIIVTSQGVKAAVWDTKNGKRRWLEQEEKPMGEPQCMVYSRSLKSLLVSHATSASDGGKIIMWDVKEISEKKEVASSAASNMAVSSDGAWLAYVPVANNNVAVVVDLKTGKRFGSYYAKDEIVGLLFSSKAECLLASVKMQRGLLQLSLHDVLQQEAVTSKDKPSETKPNQKPDKNDKPKSEENKPNDKPKSEENKSNPENKDPLTVEKCLMNTLAKEDAFFGHLQFVDLSKEFQ